MKAGAFSFCILNCVGLLAVPAISQMERPDGRQSRDYANVVSRPDSTQLDSFFLAVMNDYRIPGVAACIVRGKEIIWNGAYGYADIAEKRKVNDSTAFVIASLSKTVTGTALMQLAEKGLLNLDDDINGHLPSDIKIVNPDYPNEKITFRMLLTHTSSIDFDWTLFTSLMSWGMDSPLSTEHFVRNYFLPGGSHHSYGPFNTWAPGSKWEYSNEAMTLVGFLVDVLCDTTFEAYIDRNILNPLKISGAGWHLADMDTLNLAVPYTYDNGLKPFRHYGSPMYTCGLLKASARGLGRFLLAFMNKGTLDGTKILDSLTVKEMTTVQFPQVAPEQGLVWFIQKRDFGNGPKSYSGHTGNLFGYSTEMAFLLDQPANIGAVVLMNGESAAAKMKIMSRLFMYADPVSVGPGAAERGIEKPCCGKALFKSIPIKNMHRVSSAG